MTATNSTTALAHPNIALIKYWGKSNSDLNLPSTPSLSVTLSKLTTKTTVSTNETDVLYINGQSVQDEKISKFLNSLRQIHTIKNIRIETENNFPTSAGLASSASGFAALTTALNSHFSLGFSKQEISAIARTGSASAARSIYGGFVGLQGPDWEAEPIFKPDYWPLRIVIATINLSLIHI